MTPLVEPAWLEERLEDRDLRILDVTIQVKLKPFPWMRSSAPPEKLALARPTLEDSGPVALALIDPQHNQESGWRLPLAAWPPAPPMRDRESRAIAMRSLY